VNIRIGIAKNAKHAGGINIFGKGFGDYDQDIILKLFLDESSIPLS
jgi:predicted transcriptional regulator